MRPPVDIRSRNQSASALRKSRKSPFSARLFFQPFGYGSAERSRDMLPRLFNADLTKAITESDGALIGLSTLFRVLRKSDVIAVGESVPTDGGSVLKLDDQTIIALD